MMTTQRYLRVSMLLSGAGTAFAGYTGFALFATAFVVSVAALVRKSDAIWPLAANGAVGLAGMIFSSWLTRDELVAHSGFRLGLPTCAYGMLFFTGLLVWSMSAATLRADQRQPHLVKAPGSS